jgi:hypothetical protein
MHPDDLWLLTVLLWLGLLWPGARGACVCLPSELLLHIEWWPAYYHFVRPHRALRQELAYPRPRGGRRLAQRFAAHARHSRRSDATSLVGLAEVGPARGGAELSAAEPRLILTAYKKRSHSSLQ